MGGFRNESEETLGFTHDSFLHRQDDFRNWKSHTKVSSWRNLSKIALVFMRIRSQFKFVCIGRRSFIIPLYFYNNWQAKSYVYIYDQKNVRNRVRRNLISYCTASQLAILSIRILLSSYCQFYILREVTKNLITMLVNLG